MISMNPTEVRKRLYNLPNELALSREVITMKGKENNLVLLAEEDYKAMQETLYLVSIPKMREFIVEGLNTPLDECTEDVEW